MSRDRRDGKNDTPVAPGISGAVFDLKGSTRSLQATCDVDERWQLQAGYSLRTGGVVSSTRRNLAIFQASSAVAADPAFGPDYFSYQLQGRTTTEVASRFGITAGRVAQMRREFHDGYAAFCG